MVFLRTHILQGRWVSLIMPVVVSLLSMACGGNQNDADGRLTIAVSTPALGRLVEELGGDSVRVVVLLPAGSDPESYEPEMATMKAAAQAAALMTLNTVGFEQTLVKRLGVTMPQLGIIDLSGGISFLEDPHGHDDHGHAGGDPHLLSSPRNARQVAANLARRLQTLRPGDGEAIAERAARLDSLLAATDRQVAEATAGEGRAFVVMHPSMSYFARDYGLRQIALEKDGKEPSPRQLAARLEEARRAGARVMITERARGGASASTLARQAGLEELAADFNAADFIEQYLPLARRL